MADQSHRCTIVFFTHSQNHNVDKNETRNCFLYCVPLNVSCAHCGCRMLTVFLEGGRLMVWNSLISLFGCSGRKRCRILVVMHHAFNFHALRAFIPSWIFTAKSTTRFIIMLLIWSYDHGYGRTTGLPNQEVVKLHWSGRTTRSCDRDHGRTTICPESTCTPSDLGFRTVYRPKVIKRNINQEVSWFHCSQLWFEISIEAPHLRSQITLPQIRRTSIEFWDLK